LSYGPFNIVRQLGCHLDFHLTLKKKRFGKKERKKERKRKGRNGMEWKGGFRVNNLGTT
jgi:hypothetical protein